MKRAAILVALVAVCASPEVARAQERPGREPRAIDEKNLPADPRLRAQALAEAGVQAFAEKDYATAITLLLRAESTFHAPTIVLLLARSRAELGQRLAAARLYEEVIGEKLAADAPAAWSAAQELARAELRALRARLATIDVVVPRAPDGATLTIGHERVSGAIAGEHDVDPGVATEVTLSAPGFETALATVNVGEGKRERVVLELHRASTESGGFFASRAPTYGLLGLGGLGLGVGLVTGTLAITRASELKGKCVDKKCLESDRGIQGSAQTMADVSTATFIVGGVAAIAGLVLFRNARWGEAWRETAGARVRFVARPGAMSVGGDF